MLNVFFGLFLTDEQIFEQVDVQILSSVDLNVQNQLFEHLEHHHLLVSGALVVVQRILNQKGAVGLEQIVGALEEGVVENLPFKQEFLVVFFDLRVDLLRNKLLN